MKRKDMTHLNFITIDGIDTKDMDDAVYLEKKPNGDYNLIVAIADVSHYVPLDSSIDVEARKRGNTTYCVANVTPMLPRELSNGLCSLNEGVPKFVAIFDMIITKKGKISKSDFYKAVIISKHRTTYKDINKIINKEDYDPMLTDVVDMVLDMQSLSLILREKMRKSGNIDFNVEEIKLELDDNHKIINIGKRVRGEAERLIEMFMVTTNIATGTHLKKIKRDNIYRVHASPNPRKLMGLAPILKKFGYDVEFNESKLESPSFYNDIINKVKDGIGEDLINKMLLMSMMKAKFSTDNETGHYGLGLVGKQYSMCTSPIRRYADLITHHVLFNPKKISLELLDEISEHISQTEVESNKLEMESVKIKIGEYYDENKIGEVAYGVISGLSKKNIYLKLENFVTVVLRTPIGYEFDKDKYEMKNGSGSEFNVGDELLLEIDSVNKSEFNIICKQHYR